MGINNYLMIKCAAGTDKSRKEKKTSISDHNSVGVPITGYPLNYNPAQVFNDALEYTGLANDPRIQGALPTDTIGVLEGEGLINAIENTKTDPLKRQELINRPTVSLPIDQETGRLNNNTIRSSDRALLYALTGGGIGAGLGLGGSTWAANKMKLTGKSRRILQLLSALGVGAGGYYIGSQIGRRPTELQQATPARAKTWYHPWTTPARAADPRIAELENVEGKAVSQDDLLTNNAINEYNKEVDRWTN